MQLNTVNTSKQNVTPSKDMVNFIHVFGTSSEVIPQLFMKWHKFLIECVCLCVVNLDLSDKPR